MSLLFVITLIQIYTNLKFMKTCKLQLGGSGRHEFSSARTNRLNLNAENKTNL